jgi:nitrate/TMAO reductase-like tetraheme cytochrome c subunit
MEYDKVSDQWVQCNPVLFITPCNQGVHSTHMILTWFMEWVSMFQYKNHMVPFAQEINCKLAHEFTGTYITKHWLR